MLTSIRADNSPQSDITVNSTRVKLMSLNSLRMFFVLLLLMEIIQCLKKKVIKNIGITLAPGPPGNPAGPAGPVGP